MPPAGTCTLWVLTIRSVAMAISASPANGASMRRRAVSPGV
jgi:hypothetical protein